MTDDDSFLKQLDKITIMIKNTKNDQLLIEFYEFLNSIKKIYDVKDKIDDKYNKLDRKLDKASLSITKNHYERHDELIEMKHDVKDQLDTLATNLSLIERTIFVRPRKTGLMLIIYGKKFVDYAKKFEGGLMKSGKI